MEKFEDTEYKYDIALSYSSEETELVEKIYYYLKAENISVFFAPSQEAQIELSGRNQREAFYDIFGIKAEYVALFVSASYIKREIPMEEARIAYAKHSTERVLPICLGTAKLPKSLLDPDKINYFKSKDPAQIASHIAKKIKEEHKIDLKKRHLQKKSGTQVIIEGNTAEKQVFVGSIGSIVL